MIQKSASLLASILTIAAVPAPAQWLNYRSPGVPRLPDGKPNLSAPAPKTHNGKPDLSGLWRNNSRIESDLKPEDVLPWAQAATTRSAQNLRADFWTTRCLPPGPLFGFLDLTKIVQTPGLIVILAEQANLYRQVFMDGRELPRDPNPSWQGYSVGHWDGDTLVVETIGFNDKNPVDYSLHPHTEALRLTERYRRADFGHIELQVTIDDPKTFARSWTINAQLKLEPDTELLEFICENEKDVKHFVINGQKEIHLDSTLLSKYSGIYERSVQDREPMTVTISVDGGHLIYESPVGRLTLFAQSETIFFTASYVIEFVNDDHGAVSHLILHAAEGDVKAVRKSDAGPGKTR